jgi:hypothetical protein
MSVTGVGVLAAGVQALEEACLELITCKSVVVGLVETLVVVMVLDSNGYGERD